MTPLYLLGAASITVFISLWADSVNPNHPVSQLARQAVAATSEWIANRRYAAVGQGGLQLLSEGISLGACVRETRPGEYPKDVTLYRPRLFSLSVWPPIVSTPDIRSLPLAGRSSLDLTIVLAFVVAISAVVILEIRRRIQSDDCIRGMLQQCHLKPGIAVSVFHRPLGLSDASKALSLLGAFPSSTSISQLKQPIMKSLSSIGQNFWSRSSASQVFYVSADNNRPLPKANKNAMGSKVTISAGFNKSTARSREWAKNNRNPATRSTVSQPPSSNPRTSNARAPPISKAPSTSQCLSASKAAPTPKVLTVPNVPSTSQMKPRWPQAGPRWAAPSGGNPGKGSTVPYKKKTRRGGEWKKIAAAKIKEIAAMKAMEEREAMSRFDYSLYEDTRPQDPTIEGISDAAGLVEAVDEAPPPILLPDPMGKTPSRFGTRQSEDSTPAPGLSLCSYSCSFTELLDRLALYVPEDTLDGGDAEYDDEIVWDLPCVPSTSSLPHPGDDLLRYVPSSFTMPSRDLRSSARMDFDSTCAPASALLPVNLTRTPLLLPASTDLGPSASYSKPFLDRLASPTDTFASTTPVAPKASITNTSPSSLSFPCSGPGLADLDGDQACEDNEQDREQVPRRRRPRRASKFPVIEDYVGPEA